MMYLIKGAVVIGGSYGRLPNWGQGKREGKNNPLREPLAVNDFYLVAITFPPQQSQWQVLYDLLDDAIVPVKENPPLNINDFHRLPTIFSPLSNPDTSVEQVYVLPRNGTIAPWSSKAADIVTSCHLNVFGHLERGRVFTISKDELQFENPNLREVFSKTLYDPMTQDIYWGYHDLLNRLNGDPNRQKREILHKPVTIAVLEAGRSAIEQANRSMGLALSDDEIDYFLGYFLKVLRNPTDVELMMFAQANSEHCRHKIFNASWTIDGQKQDQSLFGMIKNTFEKNPSRMLSAYRDNAAVMEGSMCVRFFPDDATKVYGSHREWTDVLIKVETHNHPTGVAPFSGAATGSGGEIRDEGATGRGAKPKAGLVGFCVSNLRIPEFIQPWEHPASSPHRLASPLAVMLEGPVGAASYNNEFGRPCLAGFFRTFEERVDFVGRTEHFGFHKPIMIAGGLGQIRRTHVHKQNYPPGSSIVVLGGPALLIGLGGGSASSQELGSSHEALDFASVQRDNPEMQRRCQEVIDRCWALGELNPISFIHDVGAGGLANAIPEIIHDARSGGVFDLDQIPRLDPYLTPLELWCNESQERYMLAISSENLPKFAAIAEREKCPYAVLGTSDSSNRLLLKSQLSETPIIDLPLDFLLGKPPKVCRDEVRLLTEPQTCPDLESIDFCESVERLLRLPSVADKTFLITIADRSVGGLVSRDQMIGPRQIPVSDAAITSSDFTGNSGEAFAMGERPNIAVTNAAASARIATCEAITNIASADIESLDRIKLSANWQAAPNHPGQGAALFDAVKAIGMELCPQLGITIPVGKDSLSMKTIWRDPWGDHEVISPVSLVVSAFAPVKDIQLTTTPDLKSLDEPTELWLIDLGDNQFRLGGSSLFQVWNLTSNDVPDVRDPGRIRNFFECIQSLRQKSLLLAYHDRSDGGLFVTLFEMAIAGSQGIKIDLGAFQKSPTEILFAEELGAVIQTRKQDRSLLLKELESFGLGTCSFNIGHPKTHYEFEITSPSGVVFKEPLLALHMKWSELSKQMRALRDDPDLARNEHTFVANPSAGLDQCRETFQMGSVFLRHKSFKPKVAILREIGVNGHFEMAAAFDQAGFEAIDVTMSDLVDGYTKLSAYAALAVCGGFSFGDVFGAGRGWAKSIQLNPLLRHQFEEFFGNPRTLTLGVCNGCQMLSQLADLIPGAAQWPKFVRNRSKQFEARLSLVQINKTPSIFFKEMSGSCLPIVVSHGEGQSCYSAHQAQSGLASQIITMQYIRSPDNPADCDQYPSNPNGSILGVTGLSSTDGRVLIMMPHPERSFRTSQLSWHPSSWGQYSPWFKMFTNAYDWLANT